MLDHGVKNENYWLRRGPKNDLIIKWEDRGPDRLINCLRSRCLRVSPGLWHSPGQHFLIVSWSVSPKLLWTSASALCLRTEMLSEWLSLSPHVGWTLSHGRPPPDAELKALHRHVPHSALLASPHPTCASSGQPPPGALSGHLLHPAHALRPSRTPPSSAFLLPCSPLGPTFCAHPFLQSESEHTGVRQAEGPRNGASVSWPMTSEPLEMTWGVHDYSYSPTQHGPFEQLPRLDRTSVSYIMPLPHAGLLWTHLLYQISKNFFFFTLTPGAAPSSLWDSCVSVYPLPVLPSLPATSSDCPFLSSRTVQERSLNSTCCGRPSFRFPLCLLQYHWPWSEVKSNLLSHDWLFATPRTIQSLEFSRPEYWSG